ncbi:MAG: hypothetical protein AUG48_02900 [Actinobacteria bacterium 13_1_20CM_3_68_9]|nr:MAG: hypothetical protein AUG48_02900 [Actinobacteria bacterium 13_1_20CM_3_68_9]
MTTLRDRTRKRLRPRFGLALLGVIAGLGVGAYAVFAAGPRPDFSVTASPSSQTVNRGQAGTYTVTVRRLNGFAGAVTLKVTNLPTGATASWKLSDGTTANVLPPGVDRARLTIKTAPNTPTTTSHPLITATKGTLSHTTTVSLVVQPATKPNFASAPSPWSQTVLQGDQTSYRVDVTRTGGFSGSVSLKVAGLPNAATPSWNPSPTVSGSGSSTVLQIGTASSIPTGGYDFVITGTGKINGETVSRSAAATLIVEKTQSFRIAGGLTTQLAPGTSARLELTLTNPYGFDLRVTSLAVGLKGTSSPGCGASQNFSVTQIPPARYPITLPAGQTRTLGQLRVAGGSAGK